MGVNYFLDKNWILVYEIILQTVFFILFTSRLFQPNSQTKSEDNENSTAEKEDVSEKECNEETKENAEEEKKKPAITP